MSSLERPKTHSAPGDPNGADDDAEDWKDEDHNYEKNADADADVVGAHPAAAANDRGEVEEAQEEEEIETVKFAESTYSLIAVAPVCSPAFGTGLLICSIQIFFLLLLIRNRVDFGSGDEDNPFGFPPSVPVEVILAQFFGLLLGVWTQVDLQLWVGVLQRGYHAESMEAPHELFKITFAKWLLMVTLLTFVSFVGVAGVFLIIVTSDEVLQVVLGFTALLFVSKLDTAASFGLCKKGFFGEQTKAVAGAVDDAYFAVSKSQQATPPPNQDNDDKAPATTSATPSNERKNATAPERQSEGFLRRAFGKRRELRVLRLLLLFIYLVMLAMWCVVYSRQVRGRYTPNVLVVQFDDTLDKSLGFYSGVYQLRIRRRAYGFGRLRYMQEEGEGMLAYCRSEEVWSFVKSEDDDPCDYVAYSSSSKNFDITSTTTRPWFAKDVTRDRFYPMSSFKLVLGCSSDVDCGQSGSRGDCRRNRCFCREPYYGLRCDYDATETCRVLEVDTLFSKPFSGNREYDSQFEQLTTTRVNNRPVYLSQLNDNGEGDVIFFTGLRWALFPLPQFLTTNTTTRESLARYFQTDFTTNFDALLFLQQSPEFFVSNSISFNTPVDTETPVGASWSTARNTIDGEAAVAAITLRSTGSALICTVCNNRTNPCANNNTCDAGGQCLCNNGASGTLCRITPTANGVCNDGYFNDDLFGYDGGDCCEATCVSSPEKGECGFGLLESNVTTTTTTTLTSAVVHVQYPFCSDPESQCVPPSSSSSSSPTGQCWAPKSQGIEPSESRAQWILSSNGRVLVQAMPAVETIVVWDQVDSQWVPRGEGRELTEVRGSRFGEQVALFTPPQDVYSTRPTALGAAASEGVSLLIAASLYRQDAASLKVFLWSVTNFEWLLVGEEIPLCAESCTVETLGVGRDATHATVVAGLGSSWQVHRKSLNETTILSPWTLLPVEDGPDPSSSHVAVSGDGSIVGFASNVVNATGIEIEIYTIRATSSDLEFVTKDMVEEITDVSLIQSMKLSYHGEHLHMVVASQNGQGSAAVTLETAKFPLDRLIFRPIQPSMSQRALRAGFFPLSVSLDGSAIAVMVDSNPPKIQTYTFGTANGWEKSPAEYNGLDIDNAFSISSEGTSSLAVATTNEGLNAVRMFPTCPGGADATMTYRLSIPLQADPQRVSWELQSFAYIGDKRVETNTVSVLCDGCYNNSDNFQSALINTGGCLSRLECLEFRYQDSDPSLGLTSFYLFRGEQLAWSGVGNVTAETTIVENEAACQAAQVDCPEGETLFVLAISLDHAARQETRWFLSLENRTTLLQSEESYALHPTPFFRMCVSSTPQCLSFTILDEYGDGICCNVGKGRYSLFWGNDEVIAREGDEFAFGERVQFGNGCDTEVTAAVNVAVTVMADANPTQISWFLEDEDGNRYGDSSKTKFAQGSNVTTNVPVIPNAIVGCLYLTLEDAGSDGNSGYIVQYDGLEVVSSDGNFRHGERIQFGADATLCPTTVIQSSLIDIRIRLDDERTETSWYLGNGYRTPVSGAVSEETSEDVSVLRYDPIAENDPVDCFTFTITDSGGDGICCDSGLGSYSISLGWREVVSEREFSSFGESVRFGYDCLNGLEAEIVNAVAVTVDVDPRSSSWRVEDVSGTVVLDPSSADDTLYHFPDTKEEECLYFFAENRNNTIGESTEDRSASPFGLASQVPSDAPSMPLDSDTTMAPSVLVSSMAPSVLVSSLAPSVSLSPSVSVSTNSPSVYGVAVNGSYSLLINNTVVYSSEGQYRYGERVTFGQRCNLTVAPLVRLVVEMVSDGLLNETSWLLTEKLTGRTFEGPSTVESNSTHAATTIFLALGTALSFEVVNQDNDNDLCADEIGSYTISEDTDGAQSTIVNGNVTCGSSTSFEFTLGVHGD